jgi:fumarate hydratase, class II
MGGARWGGSTSGLADRTRHADQHERQRGDRQPRESTLGRPSGGRDPVHPNDHVNRGQSSNDSFPTVMHIAAAEAVTALIPALATLQQSLTARATAWGDIIKIGRTHMMDAVPVILGQEFTAWARRIELGNERLEGIRPRLHSLPQGGTGINRHPVSDVAFCERISALTELRFTPNPNKFEGMGAHDAFVELSGVLNVIAASLTKLGNGVRLLRAGAHTGLAEHIVPGGRAVEFHHAGEGRSDAVRGADNGGRAGYGQSRHGDNHGRPEFP